MAVFTPEIINYGESLNVNVTLMGDATGIVVVSVGNLSQSVDVNGGIAFAAFSSLSAGNRLVNVSYPGDGHYNSVSAVKAVIRTVIIRKRYRHKSHAYVKL